MGKPKQFKRVMGAKVLPPFPVAAPKSIKRSASPEPEAELKVEESMTRRAETNTGTVGNTKMDLADDTIEETPLMHRVQSPAFFDGLDFAVQLAGIVGDERAIKAARKICKGGRTDGTMSENRLKKLIEILDHNPAAVSLLAESMQEDIKPWYEGVCQSPAFVWKERSTNKWKIIVQPAMQQPPSVSSIRVARRNDLAATDAQMDATTDDEDQEQDKSFRPSPQVPIKEEPGVEQTRNGDGGNYRCKEVIHLDTDSDMDTDKNDDKEKQNNIEDENQAEAMGPSSDNESKSELPLDDKTNKEIDKGQETASESTPPTDTLSGGTLPVETVSRKPAPTKKRSLKALLGDSTNDSIRDAHKQTKTQRKQTQSRKQTQRRKKSESSVLRMVGGKMQRGTSSYLHDDTATNDGDDLSKEDVRDESLGVGTGVDDSSSDEELSQDIDFLPSNNDDDHCDNEENDDDDYDDDSPKSSHATSASAQSCEHRAHSMRLCYADYPKTMIRGSNAHYCILECSNDLFQPETRVVFTKKRSRNLMEAIEANDAHYAIGVVMSVSTQSGLTIRTIAIKRQGQLEALGKATRDAIEKSAPMRRQTEELPKHVRDGLWLTSTPP